MKPSVFVTTIDERQAEMVRTYLEKRGCAFSTPPYTRFSAKGSGFVVTLYASGKLTVMGKNRDAFIIDYLEPEVLGTFSYSYPEAAEAKGPQKPHIGIDESGKGDFFGPLCVGGLYASLEAIQELTKLGVRDSKTLKGGDIRRLAAAIKKLCPHKLLILSPQKYNELYERFANLNTMLAWCHAATIEDLVTKTGCRTVYIDQFAHESVVSRAVAKRSLDIDLTQRHRGEEDVVVAAASILARAAFVEEMGRLSEACGIQLPLGASQAVIRAGKELVSRSGREALGSYAKLHFATAKTVLMS
jgi:ribonuclease HIII